MAWFRATAQPVIANILKGSGVPSSYQGTDGQLYLQYANYEKHYFMDNKIVVVENEDDATDLKLYVVGLTKDSNFLAITDTDLLDYLSDITSGYLKACSSYDTDDSTTQTGIFVIGNWGSGIGIHTYINGWSQYKAGTFYGVIDLTESPVPAQGLPSYQNNPFVDPDTVIDGGILNSFAKVNNQWQNLIGTDINDIDHTGGESVIEDYITDYFPCLLDSNYYTIFSKAANDETYNGGRGGTRSSSDPVLYFVCYTNGYSGYGLIGLASASVQITATTSYGGAEYYTQTTTNGTTVYLARLGAMISGQSNTIFKNGYLKMEIDGSQYVEQNGSTNLFDQTFIDAAYEALIALS